MPNILLNSNAVRCLTAEIFWRLIRGTKTLNRFCRTEDFNRVWKHRNSKKKDLRHFESKQLSAKNFRGLWASSAKYNQVNWFTVKTSFTQNLTESRNISNSTNRHTKKTVSIIHSYQKIQKYRWSWFYPRFWVLAKRVRISLDLIWTRILWFARTQVQEKPPKYRMWNLPKTKELKACLSTRCTSFRIMIELD